MALTDDEKSTMAELATDLSQKTAARDRLDAYFEGTWRLEKLGLAVPPELDRFVTVVNWPRIVAGEVERRCDVEGFRRPGVDEADDDMWAVWQANDLDETSQLGHLDALVLGRSYTCVGTREDDEPLAGVPLITVESCMEMTHLSSKRTRRVESALRLTSPTERTLYFPDYTVWLERKSRAWVDVERDQHNLGMTPVTPLVNQARLRNGNGVSEMADVLSLTDACCRALTNAQVATEVLAVPQRYVLGASPKDFVDVDGKPVPVWETYFGAVWALMNPEAKVGQFSAADLGNFERIVNLYGQLASGASGLPTRFFGQATVNPPSEGSIIADETRLIMNAYRKHRGFGQSWELIMRIARLTADNATDATASADLARMETLWRNPETPTQAQTADAVVKLYGAGILPVEAAWEELGYSATRRLQLARMRAEELAADPLAAAAATFRGGRAGLDPSAADPGSDPTTAPPTGRPVPDAEV